MRAISTKLETLSSTTSTAASFGIVGLRMGWVSDTAGFGSDICAPCQKSLDLLCQDVDVDRFLNVTVAPRFERLFTIAAHYIRGNGHDRDLCEFFHRLDLRCKGIAVHVRHV